jgi:hypothetical protein
MKVLIALWVMGEAKRHVRSSQLTPGEQKCEIWRSGKAYEVT